MNRPARAFTEARVLLCCVIAAFVALASPAVLATASAQDDPPRPRRGERTPKPAQAEEKKDEKKDEADEDEATDEEPDRYLAIINARIHPVTSAVQTGVTVLCKNGKIHAIGRDVEVPEEAEVVDASGHEVYPGLVAINSSSVLGSGNPGDSTDVFSLPMNVALAGGMTTFVTGSTAGKGTFGTLEGIALGENLFENINYTSRSPSSKKRTRESLQRAKDYLRDKAEYEIAKRTDPDAKEPEDKKWADGPGKRFINLVTGQRLAFFRAERAHDITQALDLIEEFNLRAVLNGVREGWTVASRMGRAGVSVIVSPRDHSAGDPKRLRPNGATIENAKILHDHGVPVAIVPRNSNIAFWGLAGRDLLHLNMEAAYAVRGGLSNLEALRAITINPARILGLDGRIGSIEVGKDADFVIADGDILHYKTHARWTIVNGRVAYDKQKDTLYDHIRPDGDEDAPPPDDHWPRRLGQPW